MWYKVSGTTIQITRGDSGYFQFTPVHNKSDWRTDGVRGA